MYLEPPPARNITHLLYNKVNEGKGWQTTHARSDSNAGGRVVENSFQRIDICRPLSFL